MREYILTDIHYHTDDSFDAYKNQSKQIYNTDLVTKVRTTIHDEM